MATPVDVAIRKLAQFPEVAERAILILIRDLALETVEELNRASGIDLEVAENLVVLVLNDDHWERMPAGDICDEIAATKTDYGIGVFQMDKLPPEIHAREGRANIHPNCKCTLMNLRSQMEENSWKVIINDKGVEFVNESKEVTEKVHGTAPVMRRIEGGALEVTKEGQNPSDYADVIINNFTTTLKGRIETLLTSLFNKI